jgi:hypothetical protein
MIPAELLQKYGLPERVTADAVEVAVARALSQAFGMDMLVRLEGSLEVIAWRRDATDERDLIRIEPAGLSKQLQRQVRHHVERELEKRQVLREWETLRALRGQVVFGETIRVKRDGCLMVALGLEDTFRSLILVGECPLRAQPPRERALYHTGDIRSFLVTSVLPVQARGRARVRILLSRSSKDLPVVLLRERAGQKDIRCRRRIAGAFSEIETRHWLPREAIQAVGRELGERIIIRVLETEKY